MRERERERDRLPLPLVAIAFAAQPVCVKRLVLGVASASQLEQSLESSNGFGSLSRFRKARAEGLFE
jgi:hypothetical protein